jgi:hypothetical protein
VLDVKNFAPPANLTPNSKVITQYKTCCAAGTLCKHPELPVAKIHRCATCGFCVHAMCEVELKGTTANPVKSTSIKGVCVAYIDRLNMADQVQTAEAGGGTFLDMKTASVLASLKFSWPKIALAVKSSVR